MFAGSHEDRRFAPPSRNTTQLEQAVPEFSHSGTVTRGGGSSLTENAQQRFFVAKQRSAVMLSLFRGEHRGGGSSFG